MHGCSIARQLFPNGKGPLVVYYLYSSGDIIVSVIAYDLRFGAIFFDIMIIIWYDGQTKRKSELTSLYCNCTRRSFFCRRRFCAGVSVEQKTDEVLTYPGRDIYPRMLRLAVRGGGRGTETHYRTGGGVQRLFGAG